MMNLKLIVFDLDGVIVDTEYLDFQLQSGYLRSIASPSVTLGVKDFSSLVGRSGQDLLMQVKNLTQIEKTFAEITAGLKKIEAKKYHPDNYLPLFRQDIVPLLQYAKEQRLLLAVASSTALNYLLDILDNCGIRNYFDLIVSGEDFESSKPHPEIYLSVLKALHVAPDEAIAIEDSSAGIAAAKAAGMDVIAYEEKRFLIDQTQANLICKNMRAIFCHIKSLRK